MGRCNPSKGEHMTKDEALKLALEALERGETKLRWEAITAIKEALAQLEIDPWREAVAQPERDPWREAAAQPDERNFCPRCGKRLASGFVEISIHTCTPPQPEQEQEQEQEIKDLRTPEERRDAGQWHCPECFTFGNVHRRGCVTANKEKNT